MPRPNKDTVRVQGLKELLRDTAKAEKETKKAVRGELKEAGEIVRGEWHRRFRVVDEKSASNFRVSVRQAGVFVQQKLRKTTGLRPQYGGLQMRYGVEVLHDKNGEIVRRMEEAADKTAEIMEGRRLGI